jgi:hypothetical protein
MTERQVRHVVAKLREVRSEDRQAVASVRLHRPGHARAT